MGKIKNVIKAFITPVSNKNSSDSNPDILHSQIWSGDYNSWYSAQSLCSGYDHIHILEKCKEALLKVKNGEAVYERDSVLFDKIQYNWGLLSGLLLATNNNDGNLSVIDFGGSLGSTYFQNKVFLSPLKNLDWNIIEQKHFVDCGKENFENNQLHFYYTLDECLIKHKPIVLLLSGVLQYLENSQEWINTFLNLDFPFIIIDRIACVDLPNDLLTIQNVPKEIYSASYPSWFFNENNFKSLFLKKYSIIAEFDNGYTPPVIINGNTKCYWKGLIFKLKSIDEIS